MSLSREPHQNMHSSDIPQYVAPGVDYLNGINGTTLQSLQRRVVAIARLKPHLPSPSEVVSVGVGQGEELHAIGMLYQGSVRKIIGIDLSQLALDKAAERIVANNLPAELKLGNATDLPLADQSVDGVIYSSLLHEVYSYAEDGKTAWDKSVRESARVTRENGCVLISDSAVPEIREDLGVTLKTNLAREFYDYFGSEYRKFNAWENLRGRFTSNIPAFPPLGQDGSVHLSVGQTAELMFHLVNFQMGFEDQNRILDRNPGWKELNETYYIPDHPQNPEPMRPAEYVREVIKQGEQAVGVDFEFVCVEIGFSTRDRMAEPLRKHFDLALGSNPSTPSADLLNAFTRKMELVFKKVRKETKQHA